MSHSKESTSGDGKGILLLLIISAVGGVVAGSMWIGRNKDLFEQAIYLGGALTVLGLGYGYVSKSAIRYLLFVLGGFGLGLMLRGFATML